jgi:mevalonate kinase
MTMVPPFIRKFYPGKLLLFGEHTINRGSKGLAIPLADFGGCITLVPAGEDKSPVAQISNAAIRSLIPYVQQQESLRNLFDINKLSEDSEAGLWFDANLPIGYGLGSSGALVAAIYDRYVLPGKRAADSTEVKNILADMESNFHGKSSGLDPIVSWLDKTVLIENGEVSREIELNKANARLNVFVVDTGKPRITSEYVNAFLERYEQPAFKQAIDSRLVPAVNNSITALLKGDYSDLYCQIKAISGMQLEILPDFIPLNLHSKCEEGLSNNLFYLKLCGAGGGGFMLGFCPATINPEIHFEGFKIIHITTI